MVGWNEIKKESQSEALASKAALLHSSSKPLTGFKTLSGVWFKPNEYVYTG